MSNDTTEIHSNPMTWKNNASVIGLPLGVGAVAFFISLIIGAMVSGNRVILKSFFGPAGSVVIGLISLQITAILRAKDAPSETVTDGKIIPPVLKVLLTELAGLASLMALVSGVFAWIISVYYNSSFEIDMHRDEAISAIQKNGLASSVPLAIALSGFCLFLSMTGKFFQEKLYAIDSPLQIPNLDGSKLIWESKIVNVGSGGKATLTFTEPINQVASQQIYWKIQKLLDKKDIDKKSDDSWEDDIHSKLEIEGHQASETTKQISLKVLFSDIGAFRLIGNLPEAALVNRKKFKSERQFLFKTDDCQVSRGGGNLTIPQNEKPNHSKRSEPEFD